MKKLLVFSFFILILAGCWIKNNEENSNIGSNFNNVKVLKLSVDNWKSLKVNKSSREENLFEKVKKELDKEFSTIYSPDDSNHYENSCYLLLDVDYKNKRYVLYRNKWVEVETWWCRLEWVEKIWVLWIHNGKPDPEGEYFLKSYDPKTWLFRYVMSERYRNLAAGKNEYEFRFYMKDGNVIKEKLVDKKLSSEYIDKLWLLKIIV